MGVADPPCSGYIYDMGRLHCVLEYILWRPCHRASCSPDQQRFLANRSTPTRGATWNMVPPAFTGTTQNDHHVPNETRRRAATTSKVPRARSGWSGFADFTIRLPGPLGKVLGRC